MWPMIVAGSVASLLIVSVVGWMIWRAARAFLAARGPVPWADADRWAETANALASGRRGARSERQSRESRKHDGPGGVSESAISAEIPVSLSGRKSGAWGSASSSRAPVSEGANPREKLIKAGLYGGAGGEPERSAYKAGYHARDGEVETIERHTLGLQKAVDSWMDKARAYSGEADRLREENRDLREALQEPQEEPDQEPAGHRLGPLLDAMEMARGIAVSLQEFDAAAAAREHAEELRERMGPKKEGAKR